MKKIYKFILGLSILCVRAFASPTLDAADAPPQWPRIEGVVVKAYVDLATLKMQNDRYPGVFRSGQFDVNITLDPRETLKPTRDNFAVFRFSAKTGKQTTEPQLVDDVKEDPGEGDQSTHLHYFFIKPPNDWTEFSDDDRFALAIRVAKTDAANQATTYLWHGVGVSKAPNPSRGVKLAQPSFSPSVAPSQELLDGRKAFVGRLGFKESAHDVLPNQGGTWFDVVLSGTASTDRLDPQAFGNGELQIARRFGTSNLNQVGLKVGARSNQSGRAQAGYASLGVDYFLPGSYMNPSRILMLGAPPVITAGIRAEQRWKRDDDLSPFHVSPGLGYAGLECQIGPIWLFPRKDVVPWFATTWSLSIDARGYYFPNDESQAGFSTHHFEGYVGLQLTVPTHVWTFVPYLYFNTGAVEGQTFANRTAFGIGLTSKL